MKYIGVILAACALVLLLLRIGVVVQMMPPVAGDHLDGMAAMYQQQDERRPARHHSP
jgi:hypothetical protein